MYILISNFVFLNSQFQFTSYPFRASAPFPASFVVAASFRAFDPASPDLAPSEPEPWVGPYFVGASLAAAGLVGQQVAETRSEHN